MTIYTEYYITILPLLLAWMLDLLLADPAWLPHPVVGFGKLIAFGERLLNRGSWRRLKGGLMCGVLVALCLQQCSLPTVLWLKPALLQQPCGARF